MRYKEAPLNKKLNNKGSAIILVIIAMSLIGILTSLILWMSYMNYFMKIHDMRVTKNFYSAEEVVEQIKAGLEYQASEAADLAYTDVLQHYSEFNLDERKSYFDYHMLTNLIKNVKGPTDTQYDLALLKSYVSPAIPVINEGDDPTPYTDGYAIVKTVGGPRMITDAANGTLRLMNLDVIYYDKNQYKSEILTDLLVSVPTMNFADASTASDLFSYVYVANDTLKNDGNGTYTIDASAYADKVDLDTCTLNVKNSKHFVTGNTMTLNGTTLDIQDTVNFWGKNIFLKSGNNASFAGNSYVADDLTINGKTNTVALKDNYYGYGLDNGIDDDTTTDVDERPEYSSAIIVNGKENTLDLQDLTNIVIGGRSYIGTGSDEETKLSSVNDATLSDPVKPLKSSAKNLSVPMSESIAMRGDQMAFLVPAENLVNWKTESNGGVGIWTGKRNPMSGKEYAAYVQPYLENDEFMEYNYNMINEQLHEPLSNYTTKKPIKIFAQGLNDLLVYYYMDMDNESAINYFQKYYDVNKDTMNKYIKNYKNIIKTNAVAGYTNINIAGNWFGVNAADRDAIDDTEIALNNNAGPGRGALLSEAATYEKEFTALTHKLVTDLSDVSAVEKTQDVFTNLIKEADLKNVVCTYDDGSTTYNAIISAVGTDVVYDGAGGGASGDANTRIIVSGKDIYINADFKGTAIAKGNIIIKNGVTGLNDETIQNEEIMKAMQGVNGTDHTYDFFINGTDYIVQGLGSTEDATKEITIGDCVNYENWKKK